MAMSRLDATAPIVPRLGIPLPYRSERPPVEAIGEDSEEARKARREVQRRNGRGLFVDRAV